MSDLPWGPEPPRVLVQGLTGREAAMVTGHMLAYGTRVVAGVTPGRAGQQVRGLPVFDSVQQAVAAVAPTATLISVPPAAALDGVLEALDAGLRLIVLPTERVPRHDAAKAVAAARAVGATLIGPNCTGLIVPALCLKLGAIGGDRPARCFAPGSVAVVSRSGGMTAECAWMVARAGYGVSFALSVGGDPVLGTRPAEALALAQADPATAVVVLWGEPGTGLEEEVAAVLEAGHFQKPLVAVVAGHFVESFPEGAVFGHAAALIGADHGRPSAKVVRLQAAGALVADRLDDVGDLLRGALAPLDRRE